MQLAWLEDFVELARTRSFARAAENRCITHPAFGRRIRMLEDWVGAELVQRKQPVALTAAGVQFLDAASCSLNVLHSTRAQLQQRGDKDDGALRIATGRTLARTFFPEWYQALSRQVGAFPISVTTSGAQEAITKLGAGDVDLLITYSSAVTRLLIDERRHESLLLSSEVMLPVSAPNSSGAPRFRLSHASAAPTPWLSFSSSLTLRGILARHLADLPEPVALQSVYQCDSYDSILEMAKRGVGVAWLPERLIREELKQGSLLVVGDATLRVRFDIAMYRLRDSNPHQHLRKIWDSLQQAAQPLAPAA